MEERTCENPKEDPRSSVKPSKAVALANFLVFEQAAECYRKLASGSGPGEVYEKVGAAGTR
jgi:hypothetical protein